MGLPRVSRDPRGSQGTTEGRMQPNMEEYNSQGKNTTVAGFPLKIRNCFRNPARIFPKPRYVLT